MPHRHLCVFPCQLASPQQTRQETDPRRPRWLYCRIKIEINICNQLRTDILKLAELTPVRVHTDTHMQEQTHTHTHTHIHKRYLCSARVLKPRFSSCTTRDLSKWQQLASSVQANWSHLHNTCLPSQFICGQFKQVCVTLSQPDVKSHPQPPPNRDKWSPK